MSLRNYPSCKLLDLVIDLNWDAVIEHAKCHPQDAVFQDGDGMETPLYLAVQYAAPITVIHALLEACPDAVALCNRVRELPLHTACRYGASVQVFEALVSPANKNSSKTVLAETKWGKTPLQALMMYHAKKFGSLDGDNDNADKEIWEKMKVLLKAVARVRNLVSAEGNPLLLHAAVSLGYLGCPHKALDLTLHHCSNEARIYDRTDFCLPLHVAIRPTTWSVQSRRRYKPRELYALQSLLSVYPEAAQIRWQGRYPLHIAVSNGHTWENGVKNLFEAFPEAALVVDPMTQLLPFQGAALKRNNESNASLDTVFHLLLVAPHVLDQYHDLPLRGLQQPQKSTRDFRSTVVAMAVAAVAAAITFSTLFTEIRLTVASSKRRM